MIRTLVIAVALFGCKKDEAPKQAPQAKLMGTVATGVTTSPADGTRRVPIEVNKEGYTPDKIPGKPGEKLDLVFTRTFEAECISQVKTPDGKMVDLPMNKPVEVAVIVPQTGELGFACGMDMFHGVIVAQP
jgi:plastocyanin domain-containing protein